MPSVHHRAVLLCLADCHNSETGCCYPSVNFIARKTRCNRKTVMKVIGDLVGFDLISVVKKQGGANQYNLKTSTAQGTSTLEGTSPTEGTTTSTTQGTGVVPQEGPEPKKNLKDNLKSNTHKKISLEELPDQVSRETAIEFIDHRINLKRSLTQNAFDRAVKQAVSWQVVLGLSANQIITEVIDAGWLWPRLEWLQNRLQSRSKQNEKQDAFTRHCDTSWADGIQRETEVIEVD